MWPQQEAESRTNLFVWLSEIKRPRVSRKPDASQFGQEKERGKGEWQG
jgi:hypothetical protein